MCVDQVCAIWTFWRMRCRVAARNFGKVMMRNLMCACMSVLGLAGAAYAQPAPTMDPRVIDDSCSTRWPAGPDGDGVWTVGMAVRVGNDGRLLEARLLRGSGVAALDAASLATLKSCKLRPGQVDGQAVEAWTEINKMYTRDAGQTRVDKAPRPERHD